MRGKILMVIQNLFTSNPANVSINGFLSPEFIINRGVLQGSKLGPILFSLFINDLLELNLSNHGATIGQIHIAALGFDDIVLNSDNPQKLQYLLDMCNSWALKNRMTFNTSKCKVRIFNTASQEVKFTLDKEVLEVVTTYKYLGVILTSKHVTIFLNNI